MFKSSLSGEAKKKVNKEVVLVGRRDEMASLKSSVTLPSWSQAKLTTIKGVKNTRHYANSL